MNKVKKNLSNVVQCRVRRFDAPQNPPHPTSPQGRGRAFTMADRSSRSQSNIHLLGYLPAFTIAEILISLTIIGVIAAITLPSLRANINETTWNTQRKALYSRMSQAIAMMPSLNGYGIGATDEETASKATEVFITDGLSKVLKITNVCDSENLKKCGFPDKIKTIDGLVKQTTPIYLSGLIPYAVGTQTYTNQNAPIYNYSYSLMDTKSAAFETKNGESILVLYNPYCLSSEMLSANNRDYYPAAPYMCANFIYDLNSRKGPNQVGKDVGIMSALYSVNTEVIAPNFFKKDLDVTPNTYAEAQVACRNADGRLPSIEEGIALFFNRYYLGINGNPGKFYHLHTPPRITGTAVRFSIGESKGIISTLHHDGKYKIRCVEK